MAVVPSVGLLRTGRATWSEEVRRTVRCCLIGHVPVAETFGLGPGSWSAEPGTCDRWRGRAMEDGASCDHLVARLGGLAAIFLGPSAERREVHACEGLGDPGVASRGAWRGRYEGQHLVASDPCERRAPSRRRTREACGPIDRREGLVRRTWRA
jgi:hypothetical protein